VAQVTGRTGKGVKTLGFLILVLFGTLFSLQAKALGNFSANRFDVRFIPNPIGMARLFAGIASQRLRRREFLWTGPAEECL